MPHRVYVGLGSNLGDRKANIREAEERLVELPDTRIVKASSLYESEPHGNAKTWFINSVLEIETEFEPEELLKRTSRSRRPWAGSASTANAGARASSTSTSC